MNEKILIIDDEPDILDLLTVILRGEGYEVVVAADGEDGVARFREEHPELIISDVRMPKMNGMEVLQTVR
jgi:two-component system alkaline phosphatase synthesis response regulator PhoP